MLFHFLFHSVYSQYKYPIDTLTLPPLLANWSNYCSNGYVWYFLTVFILNSHDFRYPCHPKGICPNSSTWLTCSAYSTPIYYEIHCLESLGMVLFHHLHFPSLPCGSRHIPLFICFILQSKLFERILHRAKGLAIWCHCDQWLFCTLFCCLGYIFYY